MNLKLDITGIDFVDSEVVDFYDSKTIFFEPTNKLPDTAAFKIWGANIEKEFAWSKHVDLANYPTLVKIIDEGARCTIRGFSAITFEQVVAGEILISPYDSGNFVK